MGESPVCEGVRMTTPSGVAVGKPNGGVQFGDWTLLGLLVASGMFQLRNLSLVSMIPIELKEQTSHFVAEGKEPSKDL
jgi:hypothetical protein